MYKVTVKQVGEVFHAKGVQVMAWAKTPVSAAKMIARMTESPDRLCIVIASETGHGYRIEYVKFLRYNGSSIYMHHLLNF